MRGLMLIFIEFCKVDTNSQIYLIFKINQTSQLSCGFQIYHSSNIYSKSTCCNSFTNLLKNEYSNIQAQLIFGQYFLSFRQKVY
ncbi:hypothetical protein TTHERM_00787160 (macronuclear) [Tetrahymena thermophila SB210]|uniref:Uncharacterized protein n=1 Tax=Tetrahymena thermophila (strain SB210) TaxID=312017 RepID=Q23ZE7_TETTS|nr:hypothetical protein TTHERM_00787160 [Tetrahymena thermophila SB210]EAS01910.1 hypothetical protein TTHERM_00787160 [Tetrahymena thermophila SB210]|eukprot:XP_001022155.1 hypothetical protein TTHERM_00787160 [Tetrahymena thermophila SB210]